MSIYLTALEILSWLLVFFLLRHGIYRAQYLLRMVQQNGYQPEPYSKWLLSHWSAVLLPAPQMALLVLVLLILLFLDSLLTGSAITVILIVFSIYWFAPLGIYRKVNIKKPLVFTPRMKRLTIALLLLAVWIPLLGTFRAFDHSVPGVDIYSLVLAWLLADLLLPWFVLTALLLVYPLERAIQEYYKKAARDKIAAMPDLTIIALTGSYGKTSTKFMIDAILKERFQVCTTPGSYNTPMGICKVINQDLKSTDRFLILEMGARHEGNIDELCRIARPDIAVVTNVGVAHLESFGSVEAILRTKSALIENLRPGGTAVLNGDDPGVVSMAEGKDIRVIFAGLNETKNHFFARNIHHDEQGCRFEIKRSSHLADIEMDSGMSPQLVTMPVLGRHSVQNALLAAGAGIACGLRWGTVAIGLKKVRPVPHRLELKKQNGVLIIDDAFNSNPVGAVNALEVLSSFTTGKKYLITPGMVELGERQIEENRSFGHSISVYRPDHVFLVGEKQTQPVLEGLKSGGYPDESITVVKSLFDANSLLKLRLREGDVVLYENDLPDTYSE